MEKKRLFKILSQADNNFVKNLADSFKDRKIIIIKEPTKTLTMIKMREPVKSSLYYIGEVIVTEAILELDGAKGMAVLMGDDAKKCLDMAIIDAAYNKGIFNMQDKLIQLEQEQNLKQEKENAMHLKTKVNFNSMDSGV